MFNYVETKVKLKNNKTEFLLGACEPKTLQLNQLEFLTVAYFARYGITPSVSTEKNEEGVKG